MKNILFILFQIIFIYSYSQNVVTDEFSGQSIPNVNITVNNTKKGFITDSNGVFYINDLKKGDTLVFTALGYEPKELVFENNDNLQEVLLTRKIETLEEVVLSSKSKKEELVQLGILKRKKSKWNITRQKVTVATYIKSLNKRDDGIIKELIFKNLKVKFTGSINVSDKYQCPKYKNVIIKNVVALKLQLYAIDSKQLPDLKKPLINDNIIVVLNKNTKILKFDISKYHIPMPKNGVFLTLKINEVYDTNSKTDFLKNTHVLMYNTSGNIEKGITYYKYENYDKWYKDEKGNAIFSLNVAYPIEK